MHFLLLPVSLLFEVWQDFDLYIIMTLFEEDFKNAAKISLQSFVFEIFTLTLDFHMDAILDFYVIE
jgi:hypothetical protein